MYGFNATAGQQLDIQVIVTLMLIGTIATDDDSVLYIFNDAGSLLAENDDFFGLHSRIPYFSVPATGLYLAGVGTYPNTPLFTDGIVSGWDDNGFSNIEFNLDISGTGVPEPSAFALMGAGALALGLSRRFCR